jgi:hypothetical protein
MEISRWCKPPVIIKEQNKPRRGVGKHVISTRPSKVRNKRPNRALGFGLFLGVRPISDTALFDRASIPANRDRIKRRKTSLKPRLGRLSR